MNLTEYKERAMALCKVWNYKHAVFGLCAEAGEVAGLLQKEEYKGVPLDREQLQSELGDVLWYWTMVCSVYGFTLEEIMQYNIDKLETRHGAAMAASRDNTPVMHRPK